MEVCTPEVLQLVKRDHLTVRALSLSLLSGCAQLLTGLVNEGVSDTMLLVIECMHHCTDLLKVDSRTCQTSADHKVSGSDVGRHSWDGCRRRVSFGSCSPLCRRL